MWLNRRLALSAAIALIGSLAGLPRRSRARTLTAGPSDYAARLTELRPGDRLLLAAGTYREGLDLRRLHGNSRRPILIEGPADRSALFLGRPGRNTVELRDVSHLELRNLTLDGGNTPRVDGVKAHDVTHHVTLENLLIMNHAAHQQTVGISTKAPAWAWTIRGCTIRRTGTGLYLGNSDGSAPFVHGLIECNLIVDTIGYGLQIKHQALRPERPGLPTQAGSTIIRRNIISKHRQALSGFQGPRPNLLVGHFPPRGAGSEDVYEIYGNLLYQNLVNEPLFQGEGNLAFHDNLLVNHHGPGLWIRPHNGRPRKVVVFHNTVVARTLGISVIEGDPAYRQAVMRNAVFAEEPIIAGQQEDNVTASYASAGGYLRAPYGDWPTLDLRPRRGRLQASTSESAPLPAVGDVEFDFAGSRRDGSHLGAYAGPDAPRLGALVFPQEL